MWMSTLQQNHQNTQHAALEHIVPPEQNWKPSWVVKNRFAIQTLKLGFFFALEFDVSFFFAFFECSLKHNKLLIFWKTSRVAVHNDECNQKVKHDLHG